MAKIHTTKRITFSQEEIEAALRLQHNLSRNSIMAVQYANGDPFPKHIRVEFTTHNIEEDQLLIK